MRHVSYSGLIPASLAYSTLHLSGLGIGAFFSLMSASFAYEDPLLRQHTQVGKIQRARDIFKDMGKGMWSTGKGFGKVGALFAGIECVIESVGEFFSTLLFALIRVCPPVSC